MGQVSSPSQTLQWTVYEQLYLKDSYGIPHLFLKLQKQQLCKAMIRLRTTHCSQLLYKHTHTHTQRCHRACVEFPAFVFSGAALRRGTRCRLICEMNQ